jgi:hypothetical protein
MPCEKIKDPGCGYPVAAIGDSGDFLSPVVFMRSAFMTINGVPFFDCAINFVSNMTWTLEGIDENTYNSTGFISISSNPSAFFASLGLPGLTLDYGLYRLTLTVSMSFNDPYQGNRLIVRTSSQSTYVRITITGLRVKLYTYEYSESCALFSKIHLFLPKKGLRLVKSSELCDWLEHNAQVRCARFDLRS